MQLSSGKVHNKSVHNNENIIITNSKDEEKITYREPEESDVIIPFGDLSNQLHEYDSRLNDLNASSSSLITQEPNKQRKRRSARNGQQSETSSNGGGGLRRGNLSRN